MILVLSAAALSGCVTFSTVLVGAMLWIFMVPFLPFTIVMAPLYIVNASDTGVIGTTFSPDGTHMLVTFRDDSKTTIHRARVDGEEVDAITTGEFFDFDPVYSPDGRLIAFCRRSRKRVSHLHVMNADGSDVRQITDGRREDFTPQYSPDGSQIVFPSYMLRKQADLFVVNVETGVEHRLTDDTSTHDVSPVFLPDGETILFSRARWYGHSSPIASSDWHEFGLYAIPAAGGDVQQLSDVETYRESRVRVATSPAWRLVLFDGHYAGIDIAAFDTLVAKGVRHLPLEPLPGELKHAEWHDVSKDAKHILAVKTESGDMWDDVLVIVVLNVAKRRTREIVKIEPAHSFEAAHFTPDGEHVIYRTNMNSSYGKKHEALWIATLNGEVRRLDTAFPGVPDWTVNAEESDEGGDQNGHETSSQ